KPTRACPVSGAGGTGRPRRKRPGGYPTTTVSPWTVTFRAGSGDFAGPSFTEPSAMSNSVLWQWQMIAPLSTLPTRHPWWVQTALTALTSPWVGWVTTIRLSRMTRPPPTGMSEALTVTLSPASPPAAPSEPPPPQAARAAATPAAPVPRIRARRVVSVMLNLSGWVPGTARFGASPPRLSPYVVGYGSHAVGVPSGPEREV